MKSRTSFFDKTVLRKDITRFAPLWGLYLICGLLAALTIAGNAGKYYHLARNLNSFIGPFSIISLCYAFVAAQLLFGDLFNTRLCNALHAMPLRREGWFLTHVTAGLLMSLVPNLIMSLAIMPFLGKLWFTALLWYLGMTLHYLFFFGLALFCMMSTGNRFAAAAVYVILNFLSLIVMWFATVLYEPLMYGVVISNEGFDLFAPVVALCQYNGFFNIEHAEGCHCGKNGLLTGYLDYDLVCDYRLTEFGSCWIYLVILAVLGVLLGIAALVLYRKRALESAGDFMAFRPMRPIFCVIYTLCVGALAEIVGDSVFSVPLYIFMFIGLLVGFFTGQMLLNRTARVFKKRNWLAAVLILVMVFGSLWLFKADVFGIVRWTPDASDVVSVKVADGRLSAFYPENTDAEFTDKASIQEMIAIHELLIAEGPTEDRVNVNGWSHVSLCYTLESGKEVIRQYKPVSGGQASILLDEMVFKNPKFVLRADSLEQLQATANEVYVEMLCFTGEKKDRILAALWADGQAGTLCTYGDKSETYQGYVQIRYRDGYMAYLDIYSNNKYTSAWLQEELILGISADELKNITSYFQIGYAILDWDDWGRLEAFCELFAEELGDGVVEGKHNSSIYVDLHLHSGMVYEYSVTINSDLYGWIVDNVPNAVPGIAKTTGR